MVNVINFLPANLYTFCVGALHFNKGACCYELSLKRTLEEGWLADCSRVQQKFIIECRPIKALRKEYETHNMLEN